MRRRLLSFVRAMIDAEQYDETEGYYHFGDGVHCGICTNGALRVAKAFYGEVWGYSQSDNPSANLGRTICFGHDFAIVKGRWLVDYWGYRYAEEIPTPVFNLQSEQDRELLLQMYGDAEKWSRLHSFMSEGLTLEDRRAMIR